MSAYRLQEIEPQEGASVPRGQVRVTVQLEARGEAGAAPKDATPAPAPKIEIYLDNQSKGALSEGQNTLTIEGVPAVAHTLVVTASDPGGAVIEKKVIHFAALPPSPQ